MLSAFASSAASRQVAMLLACFAAPAVQAGALPLDAPSRNATLVRFDPALRETRVASLVAPGHCLSLALPQEWRLKTGDGKLRLEALSSNIELEIGFRSTLELGDLPQSDLVARDAAFLQRDWEGLLGRPAQSVSLASLTPGTARWTATWLDARLPATSHAMTIETFIVPLSREWVLELSLTNVASHAAYDALARQVLTGLKTTGGAGCER